MKFTIICHLAAFLSIATVSLNYKFTVTCVDTCGCTTRLKEISLHVCMDHFSGACNIHALRYSLCATHVICVEQPHKSH